MPIPNVAYRSLTCPGPLIIVRLPLRGKAGRRTYAPRWREIVKAAGDLLRKHGLRAKDLFGIDHVVDAEDWDPDRNPKTRYPTKHDMSSEHAVTASNADAAFAGSTAWFRAFYLYDWQDGQFVLAREPVTIDTPNETDP